MGYLSKNAIRSYFFYFPTLCLRCNDLYMHRRMERTDRSIKANRMEIIFSLDFFNDRINLGTDPTLERTLDIKFSLKKANSKDFVAKLAKA